MTREQTIKLLPALQAFAAGKPIQYRFPTCVPGGSDDEWTDVPIVEGIDVSFSPLAEYRPKPEVSSEVECLMAKSAAGMSLEDMR